MILPPNIIARLQYGRSVATEVAASQPDMRAYVMVIPQAPLRRDHSDLWIQQGTGEPWLRDPDLITGYEIRYFCHHAKYTELDWGWDYDQVLADTTTRIKRVFVSTLEEIAPALDAWHTDVTALHHPHTLDSSLVSSPIDAYLERPDERPHLWQP
jgi:hypothetical protein